MALFMDKGGYRGVGGWMRKSPSLKPRLSTGDGGQNAGTAKPVPPVGEKVDDTRREKGDNWENLQKGNPVPLP